MSFEERVSTITYPKCEKHSQKVCELHCKRCHVPICSICVSLKEHNTHDVVDILKYLALKKKIIKADLQELEISLYPRCEKAASGILAQKHDLQNQSQKKFNALKLQGEALHKEIDSVIQSMQSDIVDEDSKFLEALVKEEYSINDTINEIEQSIADLKKTLDSFDVNFVSANKSRNKEFRFLPAPLKGTLLTLTHHEIDRKQIYDI